MRVARIPICMPQACNLEGTQAIYDDGMVIVLTIWMLSNLDVRQSGFSQAIYDVEQSGDGVVIVLTGSISPRSASRVWSTHSNHAQSPETSDEHRSPRRCSNLIHLTYTHAYT